MPPRLASWAAVPVALVAAAALVRLIHPALLTNLSPDWLPWLVLLWLVVVAGTAAAFLAARRLLSGLSATPIVADALPAVPFSRSSLAGLAVAAFLAGTVLRLAFLEEVPFPLWTDDVSLIPAARALTGRPADFANAIRPAPFGVAKVYGTVGVLYLELYRASLSLFDSTVLGVRLPSALAGIASLATAALLGRELLPRGGGALTLLALAGLRWHLILSRWAWVAVVLVPVVDLAAWLLLRGRRRRAGGLAFAAGLAAGVGAHVYLAAWAAAAGLLLLALWPDEERSPLRRRALCATLFTAGFALAALPLFLLRGGRTYGYFVRTGYNLAVQVKRERTPLPVLTVTADALAAPWFVADPIARNDLPGRSRLGFLLGVPFALALARAALRPREPVAGFLLAHAAAATAAAVVGGGALHPNGYRFAYLTSPVAVGVAAGTLALLSLAPEPRRRAALLLAAGALAVAGALGARDALERWPYARETFHAFSGRDTLLGRSTLRWSRFGTVAIAADLPLDRNLARRIVEDRVVPRAERSRGAIDGSPAAAPRRLFRLQRADAPPPAGARVVERVVDAWGRARGVVVALPAAPAGPPVE